MARLTIKFGSKLERALDLDVKELVIGRGSDCELELSHDLVSRRHCKLRLVGDGYVVEDLGSTTGTFVNKAKTQAHILQSGDEIGIGPYVLVYTGNVDKDAVVDSADPDAVSTGAFWAQAAAESGITTGAHPGAATKDQQDDAGPAVPASALGPRGDGKADLDDYQGTMLASADEMMRVRKSLEVSQQPHLTVRRGGKVRKLALEDTTFEVGYGASADFRLEGNRVFGKRQFVVREISEGQWEVAPLSWWASVTLNGERVRSRGKLKDGALIEAGGVKFRFKGGA
jgi:pSer/pThr/pTyr-binding forkhead associated (FHA) protein